MEMTRSKGWLLSEATEDEEREEYLELFTDPERGDLLFGDMCGTVAAFTMTGGVKVHLYMGGEEWDSNWGSFSTHVPGRTEDWGSWEVHWREDGCELDDIWHYLDHANLSAIFTTQHQWLDHPKVFSVPLGQQANAAKALRTMPISDRENLLLINVRGTPTRTPIVERVVSNFDGAIKNEYVEGWEDDSPDESDYLRQLTNSKFVLCPSGMGWDTYRVWEALILGAIPILEKYGRRDGLYSSYDDLPVLWVGLYDEVTPSLLEGEYPRILSKAMQYKFEKLTNQWWIDLINSYRVK
ncbi:hypothetical protein ACHAW5_002569 [Stephanodiscus triporus]|uniref:RXYLT1 C-terminal domain-containing protein n=1 Tax=Stephanodiscus triporus TaxID=2934178 RepID=A0ABD3P503_9STRA